MADGSHGSAARIGGRHNYRLHFVVGRILGESAALCLRGICPCAERLLQGLDSAGATLTVALYVYAKEQGEFEVAFASRRSFMILTSS
jgi:phosphate transport system permease protein